MDQFVQLLNGLGENEVLVNARPNLPPGMTSNAPAPLPPAPAGESSGLGKALVGLGILGGLLWGFNKAHQKLQGPPTVIRPRPLSQRRRRR